MNIGNLLRRRVLIATDRRLFLADRGRGSRPVQLVRSVEYPQINALPAEEVYRVNILWTLATGP
jgi:hypothetical protein